jgi:hypothetical protein
MLENMACKIMMSVPGKPHIGPAYEGAVCERDFGWHDNTNRSVKIERLEIILLR